VAGPEDSSRPGARRQGRRGGGGRASSEPAATGRGPGAGSRRGPDRDQARKAALELLLAVSQRDAYANLLLPELIAKRRLTGRDAALATELSYGTLRGQGTYDAVLGVCSDRDLTALDPAVLAILRLGTHQLLGTRIGPHAAVATSVNLVKDTIGQRPAGFVNAVLRRVSSRDLPGWLEIVAPARDADPAGSLAVRYSHPRWIVEALAAALGEQDSLTETEALLAADGERPQVHLCAVPGLASQEELAAAGAEPARWSPYGAYLAQGDPAAVAAVAEGRAGVQDEASQLAALALVRAAVSGADDRWLDLCAGPGGKARLLAGLGVAAGARLVAAEVREHRARLVRAATSPSGSAATVIADGVTPAWRAAAFSRVIADVPCSGLGALRRRPEARWRRTPGDIASLGGLQRGLLGSALDAARPGGVVAYVTCSPHLAETSEVVAGVLAARSDAEVLDAPGLLPEVPDLRHRADPRFAQFWPHRHGTDAIFLALLRRR
jgi:16S rRNA (cytosine967-C5)-methyltransferase